jgi:HSP20 family protein
MAQKKDDLAPRQLQPVPRRESTWPSSPSGLLERFADQIDSVFDDFGLGRTWAASRLGRLAKRSEADMWAPDVEIYQRDNELVVRADLPGMKKDDVSVDVTDRDLTISGERKRELEIEHGGMYRSERSYGSFYRTIRLPEGAIADQAKATFKDGVLEIRLPAPPEQVGHGRRLNIEEQSDAKK